MQHQQVRSANESKWDGTHLIKDVTSRASDDSASKLGGALPNNLGEVRVDGVVGIIFRDFGCPIVDRIGDSEIASPSSQVLCK